MSDESAADTWLNAAIVICPQCDVQLYRVDRSPMADEWMLYCDQCANRVEVSYYDPITLALDKAILPGDDHYHVLQYLRQKGSGKKAAFVVPLCLHKRTQRRNHKSHGCYSTILALPSL